MQITRIYFAAILLSSMPSIVCGNEKQTCFDMRTKYSIEPGESFGTLPSSMHSDYLKLRCYRFFCEVNSKVGKGKFICIPKNESGVGNF